MLIRRIGRNGCLLGLMSFSGPILASSYMRAPTLLPRSNHLPRALIRFDLSQYTQCLRKTTLLASNCPMCSKAPNWLHVLHYAYSFQISELTTYPLSRYIFQYNLMSIHHRLGISAQKSNFSLRTAVSVYSIQRHSALITHHELFSS